MCCASSGRPLSGPRRSLEITLAAITCAVAIAACGSSSKPRSTADVGSSPQSIKYSDCMRSHGVPNFPDLNADGSVSLPSSINPQAPAFQAAQQTCASLRPGAGSPPPPISLPQQKSFVANAQCMRKHGVPNFPGPVFGPGGLGIGYNVPPRKPRVRGAGDPSSKQGVQERRDRAPVERPHPGTALRKRQSSPSASGLLVWNARERVTSLAASETETAEIVPEEQCRARCYGRSGLAQVARCTTLLCWSSDCSHSRKAAALRG